MSCHFMFLLEFISCNCLLLFCLHTLIHTSSIINSTSFCHLFTWIIYYFIVHLFIDLLIDLWLFISFFSLLLLGQSSFRFAGALKFEECVRALNDLFIRSSVVLIRDKFSRIRQVMMAITCDVNALQAQTEHYSHLTANEVQAFMSLRKDKES